ncbi:restriction endonuclease subunit S [Patescibacteria group bacterium]|nr:restriction endonuclease subunit S [Patescibacteria group bacterium]
MQNLKTENNYEWKNYLLKDCVDILDNQRVPVNSSDREKRQGKIPYYGATGLVGWIDDFLFNEELVLVGEDGAPFLDKSKPIAYLINGRSWVNNHAHVLRAKNGMTNNWFIKYYLDYFDFTDFVGGTTRLKLNQSALKNIPIKLPSEEVQEKITTTLKKATSFIEQTKLKISRARNIITKFRQAILSAAITGKLTEDWREKNNKKIDDWGKGILGDFINNFQNGLSKRYANEGQETVVLRLADIRNYETQTEHVRKIKMSLKEKEKYKLNKEDILIIRVNGSPQIVGNFILIREINDWAYCDHFIRIRLKSNISSAFLLYFSQLDEVRNYINQNMVSSAGQNTVNQEMIKNISLHLPTYDEQIEIVKIIQEYFSIANQAEKQIESAETRVSKLTQAILAKTFNKN